MQVPSSGSAITVRGEPVNWRVFPRSKYYENPLHVIYEDRLEVFSFNHDYVVDQARKRVGIRFYRRSTSSDRITDRLLREFVRTEEKLGR